MDVYDPSSYAYLPSVTALFSAACSLVDVEVVQSGRYAATEAAAGMIALLATEAVPVSSVLAAVQHEFFVNGRRLEAPGVLAEVSSSLGLDAPAVELFAGTERARTLAGEDFELALDLDRNGGPLLLASCGERTFEFDGPGATGARLVDQFRAVLATP
jgi:protein-disulfide isomerase-like protein with CxxC motif